MNTLIRLLSTLLVIEAAGCGPQDPAFQEMKLGEVQSADGSKIQVLEDTNSGAENGDSSFSADEAKNGNGENGGTGTSAALKIKSGSDAVAANANSKKSNNPSHTSDGSSGGSGEFFDQPSNADLTSCGQHLSAEVQYLKVASRANTVALSPNAALMVKITGSENKASLKFSGDEIGGLCLFVAGDQNYIEIEVEAGATLNKLYVVLRGNQPKVIVTVKGEIGQIEKDFAGHAPTFIVK